MLTMRQQSPWTTDPEKPILTSFLCLLKGAGKERLRAAMQQLIKDERLKHEQIYIDGSLLHAYVPIVTTNRTTKQIAAE
jgi:hypothetical protein